MEPLDRVAVACLLAAIAAALGWHFTAAWVLVGVAGLIVFWRHPLAVILGALIGLS